MRRRLPTPAGPTATGRVDGLAYSLWLPDGEPDAGMVILHGAGSRKENHHDMARAARGAGLAAVCFDARGHGASEGRLDARAIEDVRTVTELLPGCPLVLRGSSMGGYLAIVAAELVGASAVIAVCPASALELTRGLRQQRFAFESDFDALESLLEANDERRAAAALDIPVLLLHAEGDEVVPVEHSRELAGVLRDPRSRLVAVPGGHHRSIQHDAELQGEALRWLRRALEGDGATPRR
jgi:uncharacterized protein